MQGPFYGRSSSIKIWYYSLRHKPGWSLLITQLIIPTSLLIMYTSYLKAKFNFLYFDNVIYLMLWVWGYHPQNIKCHHMNAYGWEEFVWVDCDAQFRKIVSLVVTQCQLRVNSFPLARKTCTISVQRLYIRLIKIELYLSSFISLYVKLLPEEWVWSLRNHLLHRRY